MLGSNLVAFSKKLKRGTLGYNIPLNTMAFQSKKIIVGGWPAFAEQTGVHKKEPIETFDWIPSESDKFYYSDLRAALDKVEGSREWLKAYEFDEERDTYPFNSEIGCKLIMAMSNKHSGSSASLMLYNYTMALKDWDPFVLRVKEFHGRRQFKQQQVPYDMVNRILSSCDQWLAGNGISPEAENLQINIFTTCAMYGFAGSVPEIHEVLRQIQMDYDISRAEEKRKYEENSHKELLGCIKFLHKNPMRWFDTVNGSSLHPGHPTKITKRAMDEMEVSFPGYNEHIKNVLIAMGSPTRPLANYWGYSGMVQWQAFLKAHSIIA